MWIKSLGDKISTLWKPVLFAKNKPIKISVGVFSYYTYEMHKYILLKGKIIQ